MKKMAIHCKHCKKILDAVGTSGMKKLGYKRLKSTFIRKRRNYTHGKGSRPYTTLDCCKNCGGRDFVTER